MLIRLYNARERVCTIYQLKRAGIRECDVLTLIVILLRQILGLTITLF